MRAEVKKVREAFVLIDVLYWIAMTIWVPTFVLYLQWVYPDNWDLALTALLLAFVLSPTLEVSLGALADVWSGSRVFYLSCALLAVCFGIYACLRWIPEDEAFSWILIAETIGVLGGVFLSGAFEKWYQTTLELAGSREAGLRNFSIS